MQTQLLCTFTNPGYLVNTVNTITKNYDIVFGRIFVLVNEDDSQEILCTYNIEKSRNVQHLKGTISLHRKKHTNTLYTINALNELIKILNNGIQDNNFEVNWDNYKDTVLLVGSDGFRKVPTAIHEIVKLN